MDICEKLPGDRIESQNSKTESSGLSEEVAIDPVAEKRLLRKLDWILLPLFALTCMAFFLGALFIH
jgi:hypothetical protein